MWLKEGVGGGEGATVLVVSIWNQMHSESGDAAQGLHRVSWV